MKREYELYIMKDELVATYFGIEAKIFRLFKDAQASDGKKKCIIDKQINFLTSEILMDDLESFLRTKDIQVSKKEATLFFYIPYTNGIAFVRNGERSIYVEANDSIETEAKFFEILRLWKKNIFAVEFAQQKYGWLSPLKQQKLA